MTELRIGSGMILVKNTLGSKEMGLLDLVGKVAEKIFTNGVKVHPEIAKKDCRFAKNVSIFLSQEIVENAAVLSNSKLCMQTNAVV